MTQEEGMLHYAAGRYELHGYPLRPGDVSEVLTVSGWIAGYLAYERGWYWVAPGGSMIRIAEEMQARFQRQYLRAGWESEDRYDSELLLERWRNGELLVEEESIPPRAGNGLVILARDGRGKIVARGSGRREGRRRGGGTLDEWKDQFSSKHSTEDRCLGKKSPCSYRLKAEGFLA